jgi:hypothetical protein
VVGSINSEPEERGSRAGQKTKFLCLRVTIERMLIRGYAELLENKSGIELKRISDFRLANDKIDMK